MTAPPPDDITARRLDALLDEIASLRAALDRIDQTWHRLSLRQAMLGDPIAHRAGDTLTVEWDRDDATCALVARDLLEQMVATHNDAVALRTTLADRDMRIAMQDTAIAELRGMLAMTRRVP